MKKHFVNILYKVNNQHYLYQGLVDEVIGDNGKPIVFVSSIFKQAFGFRLPDRSTISVF